MNFLAHAQLSGDNNEILFGNFIADSVKGRQIERFKAEVIDGIQLHRIIDRYTDSHPVVKNSIRLITPEMGRYSGVAMDIFYDHFLAANWNMFDSSDLTDFSLRVYKILAQRFFLLPSRNKRILPFMIAQNWLVSYANLTDLQRVFRGMDRRTNYQAGMSKAVEVLKNNYAEIEADFMLFYPDLHIFAIDKLEEIAEKSSA